ncbi:MAG: C40 family peptidase [Lachnospiraceae bacterium]|nr:C40 family peptidase [Lachnospiraceae bacterium]
MKQTNKGSLHNGVDFGAIRENAAELRDIYLLALNFLLTTCENDDDDETDVESSSEFQEYLSLGTFTEKKVVDSYDRHRRKRRKKRKRRDRSGSGKYQNASVGDEANVKVKQDVKKNAAKSIKNKGKSTKSSKKAADAVNAIAEKTKEDLKKLAIAMRAAANPILLVIGLIFVVFIALLSGMFAVVGSFSSGVSEYSSNESVEESKISNEQAKSIINELKENNEGDDSAWKVIEKGASLIGKVEYSMDNRQGDGRDDPEYLDCSSFTAWAFHKCGYSGIPYGSTTATFVSSGLFENVTADNLQVGDIGLKSETEVTGASNHVGIYCGELKNGTKVWLHCTSSSSTSLTGNTSGPMFGAYTNFMYFRHFKGFDDYTGSLD